MKERQNSEFDRAIRSVKDMLAQLESGSVSGDATEVKFIRSRIQALQEFFDAIDSLASAVIKLEKLGISNVAKILKVLN